MNLHAWQGKKIVVAGLGSSGLSMLRFFVSQGCSVCAYDAHISAERRAHIAAELPQVTFAEGELAPALVGAEVLALSPGVPSRQAAIEGFAAQGGVVLGDVEVFAQLAAAANAKVLAITGSNGKTTVTSLTGYLCEQSGLKTVVAGNIGFPVLAALLQAENNGALPDIFVLELSSFQLETTTSLNATAATVLTAWVWLQILG